MVEVETVNTSINIANTLDFGAKHTIHHQLVHVKLKKYLLILLEVWTLWMHKNLKLKQILILRNGTLIRQVFVKTETYIK